MRKLRNLPSLEPTTGSPAAHWPPETLLPNKRSSAGMSKDRSQHDRLPTEGDRSRQFRTSWLADRTGHATAKEARSQSFCDNRQADVIPNVKNVSRAAPLLEPRSQQVTLRHPSEPCQTPASGFLNKQKIARKPTARIVGILLYVPQLPGMPRLAQVPNFQAEGNRGLAQRHLLDASSAEQSVSRNLLGHTQVM